MDPLLLFIYSSVGAHLGCFHTLAIVSSAAVNILVWTLNSNYFRYIYQGVEFWSHLVILCLTFWVSTKLFSSVAASIYGRTSNRWQLLFNHILCNTCHFQFFFSYSHEAGAKGYLIEFFIIVYQMTNDVEHFFMGTLAFVYL